MDLLDAAAHLRARLDDEVVAAAVADLPGNAGARPEPQRVAGEVHVAVHAAVHHDALAEGAEVAADAAVHGDRPAGERRIARDARLRLDAQRAARNVQISADSPLTVTSPPLRKALRFTRPSNSTWPPARNSLPRIEASAASSARAIPGAQRKTAIAAMSLFMERILSF